MGDLLSYKTLVHACAGGWHSFNEFMMIFCLNASGCVGSCTAACLTMPLTTAFTRIQLEDDRKSEGPLQVILHLVRDEGFLTLFRGGQSTLVSVAVSNFVYFYSFHGLKKLSANKNQTALKDLLFACTAGTYYFWRKSWLKRLHIYVRMH